MGYDSLRIELRYRHIWQTKWSDVDRRTNTLDLRGRQGGHGGGHDHRHAGPGSLPSMAGMNSSAAAAAGTAGAGVTRGRRARSLNRVHYGGNNGYNSTGPPHDDEEYLDEASTTSHEHLRFNDDFGANYYGGSSPRGAHPSGPRGGPSGGRPYHAGVGGVGGARHSGQKHYRSADNFLEGNTGEERDMHIIVRGGVYEVDLTEWKCHSLYWPGEAFDIMRGTWFNENGWQPVQCEYADRIEQEHLQRFLGHKMADYVWDSATSSRLEKQVRKSPSGTPHERWVGEGGLYPGLVVDIPCRLSMSGDLWLSTEQSLGTQYHSFQRNYGR